MITSRRILLLRLIAVVALLASGALLADSFHSERGFCPLEAACRVARASALGKVFGVPTSVVGLIAYGGLLLLTFLPPRTARRALRPVGILAALCGAGLLGYQAVVLKSFCPLCSVADAMGIAAGIVTMTWRPELAGRHARFAKESMPSRLRWALVAACAVAGPLVWPQPAPRPSWVPVPDEVDVEVASTAAVAPPRAPAPATAPAAVPAAAPRAAVKPVPLAPPPLMPLDLPPLSMRIPAPSAAPLPASFFAPRSTVTAAIAPHPATPRPVRTTPISPVAPTASRAVSLVPLAPPPEPAPILVVADVPPAPTPSPAPPPTLISAPVIELLAAAPPEPAPVSSEGPGPRAPAAVPSTPEPTAAVPTSGPPVVPTSAPTAAPSAPTSTPRAAPSAAPAVAPTPPPPVAAKPAREIRILEYLNAYCAHCRVTHARLERVLARMDISVKRRRLYVWVSGEAPYWARACVAAQTQGREEELFQELQTTNSDDPDEVLAAARRAGLDAKALIAAIQRGDGMPRLKADRQKVLGSHLEGLPTFDIGRRRLEGEQTEAELADAVRAAIAELPAR